MSAPEGAAAETNPDEPKLSPAELKKKAKAEKQARRAAQKEQQQQGAEAGLATATNADTRPPAGATASQQRGKAEKQPTGQKAPPRQSTADGRTAAASQHGSLPVRRRGSQAAATREPAANPVKQIDLLSHLSSQPRRQTIDGVSKDVHPSVLTLGFKMSSYEICGSTARCMAMLLAFKDAIQEYTTPSGTSLARHMPSHYLSPQIDFLKSCRPISESMGNAIRWLKNLVVKIDPSEGEQEAKKYLCGQIDTFIKERIVYTGQLIADEACKQVTDGAVVLTYAKSALVEKTLLQAHAGGTRFRVIVVDSRPLFEGKTLATTLVRAGLPVTYLLLSGIQHAVRDATVALLGAHSLLSDGMLQSRIGTASVALAASRAAVPVFVCCESVKFSGKSVLDSLVHNESAPPEELLLPAALNHDGGRTDDGPESRLKTLHDWQQIRNLHVLNLMYDVTPAQYLTQIICEYGAIPVGSVQAIHQTTNEGD